MAAKASSSAKVERGLAVDDRDARRAGISAWRSRTETRFTAGSLPGSTHRRPSGAGRQDAGRPRARAGRKTVVPLPQDPGAGGPMTRRVPITERERSGAEMGRHRCDSERRSAALPSCSWRRRIDGGPAGNGRCSRRSRRRGGLRRPYQRAASFEGLPALSVNGTLVAKARSWAEHMAAVGAISHSNLADGAPSEWRRLGENVGRGPSVDSIHDALVASPEHYQNLTDPGFQSWAWA